MWEGEIRREGGRDSGSGREGQRKEGIEERSEEAYQWCHREVRRFSSNIIFNSESSHNSVIPART